jgi:hypothetical protein
VQCDDNVQLQLAQPASSCKALKLGWTWLAKTVHACIADYIASCGNCSLCLTSLASAGAGTGVGTEPCPTDAGFTCYGGKLNPPVDIFGLVNMQHGRSMHVPTCELPASTNTLPDS